MSFIGSQFDRTHLGCHGTAAQSSNITKTQHLGFVRPFLKHLVQFVSGHLQRNCASHANVGGSCIAGQRWANSLLIGGQNVLPRVYFNTNKLQLSEILIISTLCYIFLK